MWQQVGPLLKSSETKQTPDAGKWIHKVKKFLEQDEKKQD